MNSIMQSNDELWNLLYTLSSTVSDRIILAIVLVSAMVGIITALLPKYKVFIVVLIMMSVNYGVMRVPMIHPKLNFALKNVSSVVTQSERYTNDFCNITNSETVSSKDIVQTIYRIDNSILKEKLINSSTGQLYQGYFHAEKRITSFGISLVSEFPIWLFIFFLIILLLIKKENKNSVILSIAITVIYGICVTNDCTYGALVYIVLAICVNKTIQKILLSLRRNKKDEENEKDASDDVYDDVADVCGRNGNECNSGII